jgi:myo-inositol-1(or 4)-monophosphatase
MNLQQTQQQAILAAESAGKVIIKGMKTVRQSEVVHKRETDFVTPVDQEAESVILDILQRQFPDIPVLAEESGITGGRSDYRWIIDPLDGTTNFIHGYPWVSVSIALERCQEGAAYGEPVVGVTLNPFSNDLFTARKSAGAYHNGKRIHVSNVDGLQDALLATGFPFRNREVLDKYLLIFKELFSYCHGIRRAGSAALDFAWLAAGAIDGFYEYGLSPWDVAAGAILIREAGGVVTDFSGGDQWMDPGNIVAGTPGVHRDILEIIRRINPED